MVKSFHWITIASFKSGTIKTLLESNPSNQYVTKLKSLLLFHVDWLENKTGIVEFPCIE